jgi:hypothetical protein
VLAGGTFFLGGILWLGLGMSPAWAGWLLAAAGVGWTLAGGRR